MVLRDADEHTTAALLGVGPVFMFARDRAVMPPAHRAPAECVAGAPGLRQAQALVDCEISFGDVLAAGFQITASTLPFRIGEPLHPHLRELALSSFGQQSRRRSGKRSPRDP